MDVKETTAQEKDIDQGTAESSLFEAFDMQKGKTLYFETASELREWRTRRIRGLIIALVAGLVVAIAAMTEMGLAGIALVFIPYMCRHFYRSDHESAQSTIGEIIRFLVIFLGAITLIFPIKKIIDELREYNRIKDYLENYEGYKSLYESEEPIEDSDSADESQETANSAVARAPSAEIQSTSINTKPKTETKQNIQASQNTSNGVNSGVPTSKSEYKNAIIRVARSINGEPATNADQGIDYSECFNLGASGLKKAGDADPEKYFATYVYYDRIDAAKSITQRYPEFSKVLDHMNKTDDLRINHKPFADSFNAELGTVLRYSGHEKIRVDLEYRVLLAALAAFCFRDELPEQNPATLIVNSIVHGNETVKESTFTYLFTAALWYTNYNNFKQTVFSISYQAPASREVDPSPANPQPTRPQSTTQTEKPQVKRAPIPNGDDDFQVTYLDDVNENVSEPPAESEFDRIRSAAESGDAGAERELGLCYLYGENTDKDVAAGLEWLKKAAADGDEGAHTILLGLAQKNVRNFSEKYQLVQSFGEMIMSDPRSARDDVETGVAYAKAYRELTKYIALPEDSQRRFLLFCLKVRPEVLFRKSGEVTPAFFNNEMDSYLQKITDDDAKRFIKAVLKVELGRYMNAERASVKKYFELDLTETQTNWCNVYWHCLDLERDFDKRDS